MSPLAVKLKPRHRDTVAHNEEVVAATHRSSRWLHGVAFSFRHSAGQRVCGRGRFFDTTPQVFQAVVDQSFRSGVLIGDSPGTFSVNSNILFGFRGFAFELRGSCGTLSSLQNRILRESHGGYFALADSRVAQQSENSLEAVAFAGALKFILQDNSKPLRFMSWALFFASAIFFAGSTETSLSIVQQAMEFSQLRSYRVLLHWQRHCRFTGRGCLRDAHRIVRNSTSVILVTALEDFNFCDSQNLGCLLVVLGRASH